MDTKDPKFVAQLIAELIDANQGAFAVLTAAVGDVVGREQLEKAMNARLASAQAVVAHPIRDKLLSTAVAVLKPKH